jgi:hypothetical protein
MDHNTQQPVAPWVRWVTILVAVTALGIGLWQFGFPLSFYQDFPGFGHAWVAALPPFNDHLLRDAGEGNLALGILFAWAAVTMDKRLLRPLCVAAIVAGSAHFVYHLANLAPFDRVDQIAQMGSLGVVVLLPALILLGLEHPWRRASLRDS